MEATPQAESVQGAHQVKRSGIDSCWHVPALGALAFLVASTGDENSGFFYVALMDEFDTDRSRASWPTTVISIMLHLAVSSPGYPRSNGLAEKGVQVVKRLLRKAQSTKEDFWLGLLSYRTAPLEGGRSPSELLMGRGIRSLLPDFSSDPAPPVQKHTQNLKKGRHLEPLQPGDTVRILNDGKWATKATVESYVAPRSYSVVTEDGRTFRRNRHHLLKVDEEYDSRKTEENDDSESEDDGGPQSPGPDGTDEETEDQEAPQAQTQQGPSSRRSGRSRQPPRRLSYDESFQQMP